MISFYPGPSRVYDDIPKYVKDAYSQGIMSINHRSDEFMRISERTIKLLRQKLNIPREYTVLYTSSATECWEIIAQSLITQRSYHLYNGAFGQKWYDYTKRIRPLAMPLPFDQNTKLEVNKLIFDQHEGIICLTQNETSNGTQVSNALIRALKKNNPTYTLAVDATSSMAGIALDFRAADIWFASVQKCFGLPAGLGLLICSQQVIDNARKINEKDHYNSLTFMADMMAKWQTPFTPNVLGIYLLMRMLEKMRPVREIHKETENRYHQWMDFIKERKTLTHLVSNDAVHSHTVLPLKGSEDAISTIKKSAKKKGLLLGEGYGDLKASTLRIANFPALKTSEIKILMRFLKSY